MSTDTNKTMARTVFDDTSADDTGLQRRAQTRKPAEDSDFLLDDPHALSEFSDDDVFDEIPLEWMMGQTLVAPKARPGYTQRWVRAERGDKQDRTNILRQIKTKGWRPRAVSTIPDAKKYNSSDSGYIMINGMVLCEMPNSRAEKLRKLPQMMADRQMDSTHNEIRKTAKDSDVEVEILEKSEVTRGKRSIKIKD